MKKLLLLFGLVCFLTFPSLSLATPFQINFTGAVESSSPTLGFAFGDPVTGEIIVTTDNLAPASLSFFEITIGSFTASVSSGNAIVHDDFMAGSSAPVVDSILINEFSGITSSTGAAVNWLQFSVGTENLSILNAASVVGPTEVLALWNDTPNYFSGNLNFVSFVQGGPVRFALNSVTVSSVSSPAIPEPSTMLLFGSGLVGLAAWCSKRRRTL